LQWLADDLMTIRMEMLLHRSFTEPAAGLLALRGAAETHSALPLIFGNGDFRGYFVITTIDTVSRQLSGNGDILSITVRLALRESPVLLDATAPPIPSFVPIALAAANSSGSPVTLISAGVSALAAQPGPSGPSGLALLFGDIPTSTIVRSAL
jgi:hypothetical protein